MGHILAFMMILWLGISHVSAEYILLGKDKLGEYKSVKHSNPNALEALKIIQRYSWSTISLFFDTFEHDEKEKYLDSLKYEHGVTRFINHQLKTKIAKNYVVYFVPDALFELAALSRIPLLNEFNEEEWGIPANSLNRWEITPSWIANMFNKAIEKKESRILQSVFQENIYPPKSRENKFNKSFEMHFQVGEDLWEQIREGLKEKLVFNSDENHFINVLSDDISGEIIKHFLQETKNNYIKIIKDKYPDKEDKFVKEHAGDGLHSQGLLFPISHSIDTPTDVMEKFILKSLRFSFEAERRNTFLLFRGGGGREVTVTGHTPSTYQKEPHRIEESGDIQ